MPIAPGSPLNYVTFSAPSAVDAMTQVVSIMSGWGWIQQETLANGCRLRGSSPQQGVACWLDCSVTADPDLLSIQFASRSGASDVLHRIAHVAGSIYQVHVGPCRFSWRLLTSVPVYREPLYAEASLTSLRKRGST